MGHLLQDSFTFVEENPWAKTTGIILIIALAGAIVYAIRLRNQARMRDEVRNILNEYYPLQDEFDLGENGPGGGGNRSNSVSLLGNML